MVIEVMGRYAGWIALEAGLAGGADINLIPEIPFKWGSVFEKVIERSTRGNRIQHRPALQKEQRPAHEEVVVKETDIKRTDPLSLRRIGEHVSQRIKR